LNQTCKAEKIKLKITTLRAQVILSHNKKCRF